jgi:sec-independent protein translocase protein TatB
MFGIGTTEVMLILVVALLVIGPSKLPDVARALGKGMAEFRRMSSDVKRTIDYEAQLADMERDKKTDAATGEQSSSSEQPADTPQAKDTGEYEADRPLSGPEPSPDPDTGYAHGEKIAGDDDRGVRNG